MPKPDIIVERLSTYSPEIAADLGLLRNALNSNRPTTALDEKRIREFTDREDRALIAATARDSGRIIGCESLVIVPVAESMQEAPGFAWLGFVATLPEARGQGIVKRITLEGLRWCQEQGVSQLKFTSNSHNPERAAARAFYENYGAVVVAKGTEASGDDPTKGNTDLFNWNVAEGIEALSK